MIEVDEWVKENGSIVFNPKLEDVYKGWTWVNKMEWFQNNCRPEHMVRLFGEERGMYLWEQFVEKGRNIFLLSKVYMTPHERNKFSLNLAFEDKTLLA